MRGITKLAPPGNVSPPGQAPCSLVRAASNYSSGLPAAANPQRYARSEFDCMHKPALRGQLYVEQHYLCVFCEQEIQEGSQTPRIDHWRPVSLNLQDVFNWDNLYLACATPDTCDVRKGNTPLKWLALDPDLPWPVQFAFEDVLGFTSGGRVYVRNDVQLNQGTRQALELAIDDQSQNGVLRKAILNLNAPALREARAAAIDDEEAAVLSATGGQPPTPQQRQVQAMSILASARRPGFASIRVASLAGELGVGR
jgi:uncharacterized protein (TIGR02646 family)